MFRNNKLVIIGNGFDLAHGLKTSYNDFATWYMCSAFSEFCSKHSYSDLLIEIAYKFAGHHTSFPSQVSTIHEVSSSLSRNDEQALKYNSTFFQRIIESFTANNWMDIEAYYFKLLKTYFQN